jgi:dimethylamine/trimethylamine dehydrogenase
MGGLLAEKCALLDLPVSLVTPAAHVSAWTTDTLEARAILTRLMQLGVRILTYSNIKELLSSSVSIECQLTGQVQSLECASLISVTARLPIDDLYHSLQARPEACADAGIVTFRTIGDCYGPGTIAAAVYQGHKYARELDAVNSTPALYRRELPSTASRPAIAH